MAEALVSGPRQVTEVRLVLSGRLIGFALGVCVTVAVVVIAFVGPTVGTSHPPTVVKV